MREGEGLSKALELSINNLWSCAVSQMKAGASASPTQQSSGECSGGGEGEVLWRGRRVGGLEGGGVSSLVARQIS